MLRSLHCWKSIKEEKTSTGKKKQEVKKGGGEMMNATNIL